MQPVRKWFHWWDASICLQSLWFTDRYKCVPLKWNIFAELFCHLANPSALFIKTTCYHLFWASGLVFLPRTGLGGKQDWILTLFCKAGKQILKGEYSAAFSPHHPPSLSVLILEYSTELWPWSQRQPKMHNHVQDNINPVLPKCSQAGRWQLLNAPYTGTAYEEKRHCGDLLVIWEVWAVV